MSDNQAATGANVEARGSPLGQRVTQDAGAAAASPAENSGSGKSLLKSMARNMLIYFALMYVIRHATGLIGAPPPSSPSAVDGAGAPHQVVAGSAHSNAWRPGTKYDIHVWLSSIDIPSFDLLATPSMWRRENLIYSDNTPDSEWSVNITRTSHPELWSNVTLYAHVVMLRDSHKPERAYLRPEEDTSYVVWPLVKRYPERLANDRMRLLTGELVDQGGAEKRAVQKLGARALLPHWVPELNLRVIFDFTVYPRGGIPPQLSRDVRLTHRGQCDVPTCPRAQSACSLAARSHPFAQILACLAHPGVFSHPRLLHRAQRVRDRAAAQDHYVAASAVEVAGAASPAASHAACTMPHSCISLRWQSPWTRGAPPSP